MPFAFPSVIWLKLRRDLPAGAQPGRLLKRQPRTLITVAAGLQPPISPAPCPPLEGFAVASSVPLPVVPEPRDLLQSISLQPTQKVQEVRSDSLRSGNIAVLILVHAGGRLPGGSGTAFALPYSLEAG